MADAPEVKRTLNDSVFTHLFSDRKYVLQLYQALHPEDKTAREDMIEIVTLRPVLANGIYNDLGFRLGERLLILAEAQSTWTPNIIVRALMYVTETYHDYVQENELDLYSGRKVSLPRPELYVIYTGRRKVRPGEYTLSETFFEGQATDLDVRVHVLTDGSEGDIISQYVAFTRLSAEQIRKYGRTRRAIEETIRLCRDRNILSEYLTAHEREVHGIMYSLFDQEWVTRVHEKELRKELSRKIEAKALNKGRDEGRIEGRNEGRIEGRIEGRNEGRIEGRNEGRIEGRIEGRNEGRIEGRNEGRIEGRIEGRNEGKRETEIETANRMLARNMPEEDVAELSGLTLAEVRELKAQMAEPVR